MKRSLFFAPALALLLAGTSARADLVTFSYNFTPGPVGGVPTSSTSWTLNANGGSGSVHFSNLPTYTSTVFTTGSAPVGQQSGTDISATNLSLSMNHPGVTASLNGPNGAYQLSLALSDSQGNTAALKFIGNLNGTFNSAASNLTNSPPPGQVVGTVTMGKFDYTVSYTGFSNPGPPGSSNVGALSFHVDVTPHVGVAKVPEPTTLVLSLMGLPGFGLAAWRKRRAARAAA